MKISLTNARLFLAVLEGGSLTVAAARSNLVVAAVSARIKRLEADLELQLFERDRHGMRPTLAGLALEPHARRMLDSAEHAATAMASFRGEMTGKLKVLSNSNMLSEHLPELLGSFLAQYADISIEVEDRASHEVVDLLRRGIAHLGVVASSADRSGLESFRFVPDKLVGVVHAGADVGASIDYVQLLALGVVGLPDTAALAQFMHRRATELGAPFRFRLQLPGFDALCEVIGQNAGATIMAEAAALRYVPGRACRIVALNDEWAERVLFICSRGRSELPAPGQRLWDHFHAYARARSGD